MESSGSSASDESNAAMKHRPRNTEVRREPSPARRLVHIARAHAAVVRSLLLLMVLAFTVIASGGCASTSGEIEVISLDKRRTFKANFSQAYVRRDADGDYDVILVDDPFDKVSQSGSTGPLLPEAIPPLKHIVHIRVLWRPMRGSKPDHPAATNSAFHWYVLGSSSDADTQVLHYAGTGFVKIYPTSVAADLVIERAELKLKDRLGDMTDPVGVARIAGSASAIANNRMVQQYLDEVHSFSARLIPTTQPDSYKGGPLIFSRPQ